MDTREKIVSLTELPALLGNAAWQAISGLFDPLTLTQAERIAAGGANVVCIVDSGQGTLLDANARAALLAALRSVKLVVIASREEWKPVLANCAHVQIDHDEAADSARSANFANYILERQSS